MAVIIDKGIFNNDPENQKFAIWSPFTNHIIKFHSDTISNPVFAIIGGVAKIYPDANGHFQYNIGKYFLHLYKKMHPNYSDDIWADRETIPATLSSINDERFGGVGINLLLQVYSMPNSYEETSIKWLLLSAFYRENLQKQYIKIEDGIAPTIFAGNKISIFDGFVFDMVVFNAIEIDDISVNKVSSRIFLSLPTERVTSEFLSVKFMSSNGDEVYAKPIQVKYRECDGVQLKWFGNGTWKYWVFSPNKKTELLIRELGIIKNDFADNETNTSPFISLGKTAVKHINLATQNLEPYEVEYLSDLFTSPKVYLNTKGRGDSVTVGDYLEVRLLAKNITTEDYKKNINKLEVVIELPQKTMY